MKKQIVVVGCYSRLTKGEGIYFFELTQEGKLLPIGSCRDKNDPTFIAVSHDRRHAYACQDETFAIISSYDISPECFTSWRFTGELLTFGVGVCHVAVSPDDRFVICANFKSGNLAVMSVAEDGTLEKTVASYTLDGHGVRLDMNQDRPRGHQAIFSPDGRFILLVDMGADQIVSLAFDAETGEIEARHILKMLPGEGPRHLAFHPNGKWAYVISEISNNVIFCQYDSQTGALEQVQRLSSLPDDFLAYNHAAEICVTNNGRYVLASNRGHRSVVCFEIDPGSGRISRPRYFDTRGDETRMFCLDQENKHLLIANQYTDNVVVYAFNDETGTCSEITDEIQLEKPAFISTYYAEV